VSGRPGLGKAYLSFGRDYVLIRQSVRILSKESGKDVDFVCRSFVGESKKHHAAMLPALLVDRLAEVFVVRNEYSSLSVC
jgi:hypothetical protein